ncbi:SusC/RagA family TonB-linked outer membrane protein [Bacteroidales bacterium OttesenSCG-928-I14]|nr:SusC/RagA family TonB-linked outer membrane protein [Bacteroidales bacterium OttesenSCG-928-I14]
MYKNLYKNNYRCLALFVAAWIVFAICPIGVEAQEIGKNISPVNMVTDQSGNPISEVIVSIKESGETATTDKGIFELNYSLGDVLTFSHNDFLYKEVTVSEKDVRKGLLVYLSYKRDKNSSTITDAYGNKIDKISYLGSESSVYSEQLTKTIATTILPGMAGRMAGLNLIQTNGARSHYSTSNIGSSIGGSIPNMDITAFYGDNSEFAMSARGYSPIVIVDGIQREFFAIDPEAIESVSIQKDALSSMFLGMQSSRGALIITTKNPTKGALSLSFTGKWGFNSPLKTPKPLNSYQYAYLLNEALENDGKKAIYSYDDFEKYRSGSNPYTHPDINWFDELLNDNAVTQSYNLNVSGGNNVAQYFVSLGYMGEDGMFKTSSSNPYNTNLSYQRYLISSKVNVNVTQDFTANIMLMGRLEDGNQPGGDYGDRMGYSYLLNTIYTTPNSAYPIKNIDGSWGGNKSFTNNLMAQSIYSGYIKDNARDVLGNIKLNYDFDRYVKGLSLQAVGTITTQTRSMTNRTKKDEVKYFGFDELGNPYSATYGTRETQVNRFSSVSNYQDIYGQFAVNYDRNFKEHGLKASIKADTRTVVNNFYLPEIPSNIMGNAAYNYANKYFVQAAITESYYNRYAPGMRWGTFYAFGLGWDISNEKFMESAEFLNQLKLRAVYGKTGNGISNSGYYAYTQTFQGGGTNWYPLGNADGNNGWTNIESTLANSFITWEKADKMNVGLDLSVFNNRLKLNADYYNDSYYDLLQIRGKSIELIGTDYPAENIGKSRRYGAELSLTYQDNIGKFNYYITGNWNIDQSEVVFIDEQDQPEKYLYRTGKPIGTMFGLVADGFLTAEDLADDKTPLIQGFDNIQPGDIKYVDKNLDGIIDEFDCTVIGGDKPISFFGLDLGFEYRGFEFSMLWQGVYNRDIYLNDKVLTEGFQQISQHYGQAYEHMLDRWTPETAQTATFPRLSAGGNRYNQGNDWGSSFWVRSGNFIRLKNLYLAYSLPESVSRNYLGNLRVKFFVGGQNLLTMSACDLVDPEANFTNYPMQKNINFGINIKF